MARVAPTVDVVIPTRNRPEKLANCLAALARARRRFAFDVWVSDSSDPPRREAVRAACSRYDWVHLHEHERVGFGPARNEAAGLGEAPLVVSVDDDVYVYEDTIGRLVDAYAQGPPWSVVAGSVAWGDDWSAPVVMRPIGYGRKAREGEDPDFLITALYLFPREVGQLCPFNERIRSSDDRFIGVVWRARGIRLRYEPTARAAHDDEHTTRLFTADHQESHIYANLFDALFVRRRPLLALAFEVLGFAAGVKGYRRPARTLITFLAAWVNGHRLLWRDRRYLAGLARAALPERPPAATAGQRVG